MHIKHFYYSKCFKRCFSSDNPFAFFPFLHKLLKEKYLLQKYFCKIKVTSATHMPNYLKPAFCLVIPCISQP